MATALALLLSGVAPAAAAETTGSIQGRILDASGGLLVRGERNITIDLYGGDEVKTPTLSKDVVLTSDGRFEVTGVPAGRYAIAFRPEDPHLAGEWWGDTRHARDRAFVDIASGGAAHVEARLSGTVVLGGDITLRDIPHDSPSITIAATSGDAEVDGWLRWRITKGQADRSYQLFVIPGVYDLSFADESGAYRPLTVRGVQVGDQTVDRDVTLAAARASISGTLSLRTATGMVPLHGGYLKTFQWSVSQNRWVPIDACGGRAYRSGDVAWYVEDCLGPGRYKLAMDYKGLLTFRGGGDLQSAPEIVLADSQTLVGVDFVVDDPATVSGIVATRSTDGTVSTIYGGHVTIWRKTANGGHVRVTGALRTYGPNDETTAQDGEFEAALAPGTYVFKVWSEGWTEGATYLNGSRFFEDAAEITLGLGENRSLGTVLLPRPSFTVGRVAGADRFATAVAASKKVVPTGSHARVVYLTNAFDFPDALAAGPAAMRTGGVVLPVAKATVPKNVADELRRLKPTRIVLAGGVGVISESVRATVTGLLPSATIVRLGGADRYSTGDKIVRDAFGGGSRYAIVATGATYPDALAAGPAAGHLKAPVLLVDGAKGLTAATKATLAKLGVKDVYIAGGVGVVSKSIESGLRTMLGSAHVKRLSGSDRVFTAIAINDGIFADTDYGFMASSAGFADALAGGVLAAAKGGPLYLANKECVNVYTLQSLHERKVAGLTLLGGSGVLGRGVEKSTQCR
ncbi:cell wall-binding repeat-containing protein [Microbacterium sp. NPDC057659]|uniref:cell wall-binding repeat-containing protein n=1 Tax=Microbacterium sp. NPDC057659 TaxID=3346198 RepID=UPI00366A57F3